MEFLESMEALLDWQALCVSQTLCQIWIQHSYQEIHIESQCYLNADLN